MRKSTSPNNITMPFIKKRNLRIFLKNTVRLLEYVQYSDFTSKRSRTFLSFVKTIVQ